MSTNTTNYNLKKPTEGVDPFLLEDWNDNFDKIDTEIKNGRDSDNTTNSSTVTGSKVSDAFDTLKSGIDTISSSDTNAGIGVYHMRDIDNTDTYAGTFTGLTLSAGLRVNLEVTNTNTGASSFNLNGGGAVDIKVNTKYGTQRDVYAEEIWGITELIYDGTYWVLFDEKRAVGNDELSQEKSIYSTGVGIDSSNADQDYQDVLEDSFSRFELEGRTLVNLPTNGDFSNGTTGWTTANVTGFTTVNDIAEWTATAQNGRITQSFSNINGNVYFFAAHAKSDTSLFSISLSGTNHAYHSGGGSFEWIYSKFTSTLSTGSWGIDFRDGRSSGWTKNYLDQVFAVNLTSLGLDTYFDGLGYTDNEQELIILDWIRNGYFEGIANNKNPILFSAPAYENALHYSTTVVDGELVDESGDSDRDSVMTKKIVGDGSTYIRFADFPSETVTYYDLTLDSEQTGSTDASGDFVLPVTDIGHIIIDGHIWVAEEIIDIATQTSFVSTDGLYVGQFFLTDSNTIQDDYRAGAGL